MHRDSYLNVKRRVLDLLTGRGVDDTTAHHLVNLWLVYGDFLLIPLEGPFDMVLVNPPYIRQEMIPDPPLAEYRTRYATIYDRADIYKQLHAW